MAPSLAMITHCILYLNIEQKKHYCMVYNNFIFYGYMYNFSSQFLLYLQKKKQSSGDNVIKVIGNFTLSMKLRMMYFLVR